MLHMTPMEVIFSDGIELARRMGHSDQAIYWDGYLAGLMRAFFGRQAVRNSQHETLSDPNKTGGAAAGYRDGYRKLAGCPGWTDLE